jgi:hypothetical protein
VQGGHGASLPGRLCLLVLPLLVAAAALRVSAARGPEWLGSNHDPTYTYLLSALAIAEGSPPGHVDHPGTPVQAGGALVLRLAHALIGTEPVLADDVLAHPEMYLGLLSGLCTALFCTTLWGAGRVLLRVTGRLAIALAGQAAPFASVLVLLELPTFKPEPLLLSIGTALAGLAGCTLDGRRAGARLLAAMGALAGLAVATKVSAAPLLALPLVLACGLRQRMIVLGAALATAVAATAPAWPRANDLVAFLHRVATGRGMYGVAENAHLTPYGPALRAVASQEWLVLALGASAAIALAVTRRRPTGDRDRAERRVLGAIAAALAAQIALVSLHPYNPRYVVPVLGPLGLAAALIVRRAPPGAARAAAAAVLLVAGTAELGVLAKHVSVLGDVARLQLAGDALVADYPQCPVVTSAGASSPRQALRHADEWTKGRYGFVTGVAAEALARSPCVLLRGSPDAPLPFEGRLTLLSDSTFESVRLLVGRSGGAIVGPFDGWTATDGLGALEGPYPRRRIVRPVRWGLGRATRLTFAGTGGPVRLVIDATSYFPGQSIAVSSGNRPLARLPVGADGVFVRSDVAFDASAPAGDVVLEYDRTVDVEGRPLSVLFSRLSLERLPASR